MKFKCDVSVAAIVATVGHAPFVVAPPFSPNDLPRGYGRVDVKISQLDRQRNNDSRRGPSLTPRRAPLGTRSTLRAYPLSSRDLRHSRPCGNGNRASAAASYAAGA